MKISAIVSTLGRSEEVDRLLASMNQIINYSHEIIVVDQNFNDSLENILQKYVSTLNIVHKKVDFRSLSKAKNYGIREAKGEIICFPDDDSTLFKDTIDIAIKYLCDNEDVDCVFGKCIDEKGIDSVIKFSSKSAFLNLDNFEGKFVEATMFAKTEVLKRNLFDENLGIGSFFGAEEGFDLVYRLLKRNKKLFFNSDILFYHPQTILNYNSFTSLKRVYNYRLGFSYLCMKHSFYKKFYKRLFLVGLAIVCYLFVNKDKFKYYIVEFLALSSGGILANKKIK